MGPGRCRGFDGAGNGFQRRPAARHGACSWRRAGLISLLLAQIVASAATDEGDDSNKTPKQLVVVCNAYADARPVQVGERLSPPDQPSAFLGVESIAVGAAAAGRIESTLQRRSLRATGDIAAPLQRAALQASTADDRNASGTVRRKAHKRRWRKPLKRNFHRVGSLVSDGLLWTRSLEYGTCEEYYVHLTARRLVFVHPETHGHCELEPPSLPSANEAAGQTVRYSVVVTRLSASSWNCTAISREVPWPLPRDARGNPSVARALVTETLVADPALPPGEVSPVPAEIVLLDAFTHSDLTEEEKANNLTQFSRVDSESEVRLEDMIEAVSITAEVVGSRTLSFDRSYLLEARRVHMVLEDLEGSRVYDRSDRNIQPGKTYIGIRLGLEGSAAFPERLLFYMCERTGTLGLLD